MGGSAFPVSNVTAAPCNVTAAAHPQLWNLGVGTMHHVKMMGVTACMIFVISFTMFYESMSHKVSVPAAYCAWRYTSWQLPTADQSQVVQHGQPALCLNLPQAGRRCVRLLLHQRIRHVRGALTLIIPRVCLAELAVLGSLSFTIFLGEQLFQMQNASYYIEMVTCFFDRHWLKR